MTGAAFGIESSSVALLALAGVLALVLLLRRVLVAFPHLLGAWGPRLRAAGPRNEMLALEQTLVLDARRRLLLVRVGTRRAVLLTGGGQDVVVGWLGTGSERDAS